MTSTEIFGALVLANFDKLEDAMRRAVRDAKRDEQTDTNELMGTPNDD